MNIVLSFILLYDNANYLRVIMAYIFCKLDLSEDKLYNSIFESGLRLSELLKYQTYIYKYSLFILRNDYD